MVRDRRNALNEYKRDKSVTNRIEFKKCSAIARRTIRVKKRENFKFFSI